MSGPGRALPKDAIKHWPEVFGDVHLNVVPLRYLHTVLVNFKDGKTWEIKITLEAKRNGWPAFERNLADLVKSYEDKIDEKFYRIKSIK